MRNNVAVTSTGNDPTTSLPTDATGDLPAGWTAGEPDEGDAAELTELLRRHESRGRGWAGASEDDLLVEVSARGALTRQNVALRDEEGRIRGWASAHDRAAGRMLLVVVVDHLLDDTTADQVAEALLAWADEAARVVGAERGLDVQQIDSGAFADDERQHRWLSHHGYEKVRTWWQMTRPVTTDETERDVEAKEGVRIRVVRREGSGMPDEDDLRTVHDVIESAFTDHFNHHEETFDEFVFRLREDPGHRWDHWWIAELVDGDGGRAGRLPGRVGLGGYGGQGRRQLRGVHRGAAERPGSRRREDAAEHDHRRRRRQRT